MVRGNLRKQDPKHWAQHAGQHQDQGTTAAQDSQLPGGGVNPFKGNGAMISRDPKEWGDLPPKDRDKILQDLQSGVLKSYQEQVRKYYATLAEIGRSK